MNSIINFLLLTVGIIICVYSFIMASDLYRTFKFYNPDLIIPQASVQRLFGIPILLMGIGYIILEKYDFQVNNWLKWMSIPLFISSFLTLLFLYIFNTVPHTEDRLYKFDNFDIVELEEAVTARINLIKRLLIIFIPIFFLSFLLSVINWIRAVISSIN